MTTDGAGPASEHSRQLYSLCMGCGALLRPGQVCERCGPQLDLQEDEEIQIKINLAVQTCDQCQAVVNCGERACPSCRSTVELTDPRTASINRTKIQALGDLLPEFERLAAVPQGSAEPTIALTDEQLLSYVNRNSVFARLQMHSFRAVTREIDLTSEESIRSRRPREAFEALLSDARQIRLGYDELTRIRMLERLDNFHALLLASSKAVLEIYLHGARALLAITIEEASTCQRALQSALDRAAEAAGRLSDELDKVDFAADDSLIDRRLCAFTGRLGPYQHQAQPDFAAVLAEALQHSTNIADLSHIGAAYFDRTLSVDPGALSPEHALPLYLMAAATAVSDDPLTLRRRANALFELLNDAFKRDPAEMTAAVVAAIPDVEDALVALLSVGDQLRSVQMNTLSREATRLTLSQTYSTLVEWVFRRLINLSLAAKFVLSGRSKRYGDIQAMQFGNKYHALRQEADPRYEIALMGVAKVMRNAGAHGEVDLSRPLIHLRAVDRKGRVEEEDLSDEEFADRLADLLLTCLALRLSSDLFSIEHRDELPEATVPTTRRVAVEVARAIVGYWGLSNATVRADSDDRTVVVEATRRSDQRRREAFDFLAGAATLAVLFRGWPDLHLRVMREDALEYELTVPTKEAVAYLALPNEAKLLAALKLWYLSTLGPSTATRKERYVREWIMGSARFMAQQLAKMQQLRTQLPRTRDEYAAALEMTIRNSRLLDEFLRTVDPPPTGIATRDRFRSALNFLEKGLTKHLNQLRAGRWAEVQRRSDLIERAVRTIADLMA